MSFWVGLLLLQDQPVEKPMRIRPMPVERAPKDFKPQEGTCTLACHENLACPEMAAVCRSCNRDTALCASHGQICKGCADKHQVCPFCAKALPGSKSKVQEAVEKSLPEHRLGRECSKSAFSKIRFFMILHSGSPCKACPEHAEALAAVDEKGAVRIVRNESELAELLKGCKGSEAAAELVQALWVPIHGDLKKTGDSTFEYQRGHATWKLEVEVDADGALQGLKSSDTGRKCH